MKTLLLAAVLITATSAVAAPGDAPAMQTAPAVALSPYEQLTQTAKSQFDAKDWAGMQKTMEQALQIATTPQEKSEALRRLTGALFEQELHAPAREAAQKMLALGVASAKDNLEARNNIISSYMNEDKWEEARQASDALLADPLTPDEAKWQPRFSLGMSYGNLKNEQKAREQLELVAADNFAPFSVRGIAQLNLGQSYQKLEDWDGARQNYNAVTKTPGISGDLLISAYKGLGEIAEKQDRTEDAASAFAVARKLWMQKADSQFKAKDWKGAIESYQSALETGVPDPKMELVAHMQLGTAYQSLGDNNAAIAEFQYIVDTEPDVSDLGQPQVLKVMKPLALSGLAKGYIAQQKFELARTTLNQFMESEEVTAMLYRKEAEDLLQSLPPKP